METLECRTDKNARRINKRDLKTYRYILLKILKYEEV